jgi:hypothetical protein
MATTYRGGDWASLRLSNFRRFEDTGQIDFAPITLFLGRNSSGKTSLLRAPLLVRQLATGADPFEVTLSGSGADYGSYKELVYEGQLRRDVGLSFGLNPPTSRRSAPRSVSSALGPASLLFDAVTVDVALHWNVRNSVVQMDELCISSTENPSIKLTATRHGPYEYFLTSPLSGKRLKVGVPLTLQSLRYFDIGPPNAESSGRRSAELEELRSLEYLCFTVTNQIQSSTRRLIHIGPLRQMPDRAYRVDQSTQSGSGGSVVNVLERVPGAVAPISEALALLGMARAVTLRTLAPGYVAIVLTDAATGRQDNLADVGFGVSQVLPILTTLATMPRHSTVIIEQPELHLHPDAQGKLVDVLVGLAAASESTLIMETHSEHMLLRLQRRVAEGALAPDDVGIYFVDEGSVHRARISPSGRLDDRAVPAGFFEEEWEDSVELARAAASREDK